MGRLASVGAGATTSQYEILLRLASGGMAEIFIARARTFGDLERHVVLKRVLPERSGDPEFVRMFLDEARLAAQLHHPNVAQVYDIGRLASGYFFTMEYVHGHDVAQISTRVRALRRHVPISHVLTIIAGAAAGLHHAHDRRGADQLPLGVVHRDVTPSNIMVSFEGGVKLVDFGIAKAAHRATETRAGTIKGKIEYLSPEQCSSSRDVDRRCDVFSLGIVMWELLTSQRLYRRDTEFLTMNAIVNEDAPAPSLSRPDVPPDLDRAVLTALARDPDHRFPTAGAMLEEIEAIAARHQTPISTTALGRYLRELFGERPEPWIEHSTDRALPSTVVTATTDRPQLDAEPAAQDSAEIESALAAIAVITSPVIPAGVLDASPAVRQPVSAPVQRPKSPRSSLVWMTISFVVTLAIGSVIYLAVHRDRGATPGDAAVATTVADGPSVAVSGDADVAMAADAAMVAMADAGVAVEPIDAAVAVAPTPSDAAPTDAAVARTPTDARDPSTAHPVDPHRRPTRAQVVDAVRRGDWATAFAACAQLGGSAPADVCTIAACNAKRVAAAADYLRAAGEANRARLVAACQRAGVTLDKATSTSQPDPCEVDPMSCQR